MKYPSPVPTIVFLDILRTPHFIIRAGINCITRERPSQSILHLSLQVILDYIDEVKACSMLLIANNIDNIHVIHVNQLSVYLTS